MTKEDAQKVVDVLGMVWRMVGCSQNGCITLDVKASQTELHRLANEIRKAGGIPVIK